MERHRASKPDLRSSCAQAPWASTPCRRALVAEHALWIGNQAATAATFSPIWTGSHAPLCSALSLLADQFQGHKVGIPVGLYSVLAMSSRLVGALRSWRHCKVVDGTAEQWKHYLDLCGCHGKNNCLKKMEEVYLFVLYKFIQY